MTHDTSHILGREIFLSHSVLPILLSVAARRYDSITEILVVYALTDRIVNPGSMHHGSEFAMFCLVGTISSTYSSVWVCQFLIAPHGNRE